MKRSPGLSSSGGSRSPPPAADLAHSSSAAADHQGSSEEFMVITIQNHLPIPKGGKAIRSATVTPFITVGSFKDLLRSQVPELEDFLQSQVPERDFRYPMPERDFRYLVPERDFGYPVPERDFLLLQESEDVYFSALFPDTATLADCHVTHGDTLHLISLHTSTFRLGLYDNSPPENFYSGPESPYKDGKFIYLQPSVYYTVAHLKEMIFRITGYLPEHQLLNPLTTRLHQMDNRTLQSLGFKSSDPYNQLALYNCPPPPPNQLLPPSPPKIRISITHDFFGGRCEVPVDPNITVDELRDYLCIGSTTCLRFGSTVLESDKTLSDYKITHGDIIVLSDTDD